MVRFFTLLQLAAIFALTGCASITPVVTKEASVDASSGYVAGLFTRTKTPGTAFLVRDQSSGQEFMLPLGEDSNEPKDVKDQTVAIKLPPGRYAISHWVVYSNATKVVKSKFALNNPALNNPFEVKAGSVTHLGAYNVSDVALLTYVTTLRLQPRPLSQAEVYSAFTQAYPSLTSQSFRCLLCRDTNRMPVTYS